MTGERKDFTQYGTLSMRAFDIAGNSIQAFYDSQNNLVFVLDNTINASKPNVLLVINPEPDKKWDEILSHDYNVDLETVRPKQDNKYQKLDIEYSGLGVYENLINAYLADDDMEDFLDQLNVLRNSAARHSALMRLDVANDVITKTNNTIVKTKKTIINLQDRIKALRAKLLATKKEIGKVSTKQSAAKILKLESQIEATNEKLKRAKKRLESAQKRLDSATADAEAANALLNQAPSETMHDNPVVVAPKYEMQTVDAESGFKEEEETMNNTELEDMENTEKSDVKPLFEEDPNILDENIAFKPISFDTPSFDGVKEEQPIPTLNTDMFNEHIQEESHAPIMESFEPVVPVIEETKPLENKPVLESMTPLVKEEAEEEQMIQNVYPEPEQQYAEPVVPVAPIEPVVPPVAPVPPISKPTANITQETTSSKPTFVYYLLLGLLIILSVFTLWLYQKNVKLSSPVLTAKTEETIVEPQPAPSKVVSQEPEFSEDEEDENVFLDEVVEEPVESQPVVEEEPVIEPEEIIQEPAEPEIIDAVPARVMTSGYVEPEEETVVVQEDEIIANKPVYEPGAKHDDMFVDEQQYSSEDQDVFYDDDVFYDAEEAEYQAEQNRY